MGNLFKTKKKHHADTQTIRVVENDMLPDLMAAIQMQHFISGETYSNIFAQQFMDSSFRKIEQAYKWAKQVNTETGENNYYYQTPNTFIFDNTDGYELAIAELKSNVSGSNVNVDYMHFRPKNNIFMGWKHLTENMQYNPKTNEVESLRQEYLYSYDVVVPADNPDEKPVIETRTETRYTQYYLDHMVGVYETGPTNPEDGINYFAPSTSTMEAWDVPSTYGFTPIRGNFVEFNLSNDNLTEGLSPVEEIRVGINETESVEIWVTWKNPTPSPPPITIEQIENGDIVNGVLDISTSWTRPDFTSPADDAYENRNLDLIVVDLSAAAWTEENPEPFLKAYEQEYYQARYSYTDADGSRKKGYWVYDAETGPNAALNAVFAPPFYINPGSYFPILVFTSGGLDTNGDRTINPCNEDGSYKLWEDNDNNLFPPEYMAFRKQLWEGSVELADKIGFDFEEMGLQLAQGDDYVPVDDREPGAPPPSGGEKMRGIQQAVMMMGIPITTNNELEIKYLFDWFNAMRLQLPEDAGYFDPSAAFTSGTFSSFMPKTTTLSGGDQRSFVFNISDADFNFRLSFDDISVRIQPGTLVAPPIGEDESAEEFNDRQNPTYTNTFIPVDTAGVVYDSENPPIGVSTRIARVIRKAIPETSTYVELVIVDPGFSYPIQEGVQAPFGNGNDGRLLIPIDMGIVRNYRPEDREVLYFRSLHMVMNSHTIEKIKWYQQSWFKIALVVVAIVIAWWTGYWDIVILAAKAGFYGFAVYMFLVLTIQAIIISYGISLLLEWAVSVVGVEVAIVLTIAIAVYTGYVASSTGSTLLNSAAEALQVVTSLAPAITNEIASETQQLLKDATEEQEIYKALNKELQKVTDELKPGIDLDLYVDIRRNPFMVPNESSEDYFMRTLETNPGVELLEISQNFLDTSLKLPDIGEF